MEFPPPLLDAIPDNPYLLLTPGPLSTTKTVRAALLRDWCTWDRDYNDIIQRLRADLVGFATARAEEYTATLMQGSGTFCVESAVGSAVPRDGRLLVIANGAYGDRIAEMARVLGINLLVQDSGEVGPVDLALLDRNLAENPDITHLAVVHCETTTGMLNDIAAIGKIVKKHQKTYIVDAMSSFCGVPFDLAELGIDFMISSANKCIQGVPGFGFILARREALEACRGNARSLSLDLYGQWAAMENGGGKWRYTSPTHVVRAFCQAVEELKAEGPAARHIRYAKNQKRLVAGMAALGFRTLLAPENHSPIITAFLYPENCGFTFNEFYTHLKSRGFVIYPGKVSKADTFRIGNIGDVHIEDIERLLGEVSEFIMHNS
ncbi:MAG: 2-aminoethylphosphonate--pyruvate transaminase [Oscillospiraceae bacterium]|nr:2-aminoethylphosphonate--pyruvate transaminase [Oscillospiraceae bacterium]